MTVIEAYNLPPSSRCGAQQRQRYTTRRPVPFIGRSRASDSQASQRCSQSDRERSREPTALAQVLDDYSLAAQPLDRGTDDPTLRCFYTVDVPRDVAVDDLLQRLKELDAVEAAYVKPVDEMP